MKNKDEDFDNFDDPLPQKELTVEDMNRLAMASGGVAIAPAPLEVSGVLEVPKEAVERLQEKSLQTSLPAVVITSTASFKSKLKESIPEIKEIFQSNIPKVNDNIIKHWLEIKPNEQIEATVKGTVVAVYKKNNPYPTLLLRTRGGLKHFYPDDEAVVLRRIPTKS